MKMIDILRRELKEGMTIENDRELSNKYKLTIAYDGMKAPVTLPKACVPGCEREVCRKTIDTALSTMYINAGNLAEAKKWLDGKYWEEADKDSKENTVQTIREFINNLIENRDAIALRQSDGIDYYSFLCGFDYVLDELKYLLKTSCG